MAERKFHWMEKIDGARFEAVLKDDGVLEIAMCEEDGYDIARVAFDRETARRFADFLDDIPLVVEKVVETPPTRLALPRSGF